MSAMFMMLGVMTVTTGSSHGIGFLHTGDTKSHGIGDSSRGLTGRTFAILVLGHRLLGLGQLRKGTFKSSTDDAHVLLIGRIKASS